MSSNPAECIVCLCKFQHEPCKDPQYFTSVFDTFCRLLEINLIQGMQWNFVQDDIPFCKFCYSTVGRLKRLHDQLNLIQKDIAYILEGTKHKIVNSGCARNISNESDAIDRVSYIRQQAVRGIQLVENPANNEITNPKEDTDVLIKAELNEEETNENTSSFLHGIKEEPTFQEERDVNDSLDVENNESHFETACTNDNGLFSGEVTDDSDLIFTKSEAIEESVEISLSTSDVIISDATGSNKCNYCEETFRRKRSLRSHLKHHLEEILESGTTLELCRRQISNSKGAFKCGFCHEGFYSANDLQDHAEVHYQIKPFQCDQCGKCFNRSKYLKLHQISHRFKCKMCSLSFSNYRHLKLHRRTHTVEKPYKCDTCGKCFRVMKHLNVHIKIHSGEKAYKCEICPRCFADSSAFKAHRKNHSAEKPYKCNSCEKTCRKKSHLKMHMRMHSGESPASKNATLGTNAFNKSNN